MIPPDVVSLGMLMSYAAQDPEKGIPILAAMNAEPPKAENPLLDPFGAPINAKSPWDPEKKIPGMDVAPPQQPFQQAAAPQTPPQQTYPDTSVWGDPTGGGAAQAYPPPATPPPGTPPQPQPQPVQSRNPVLGTPTMPTGPVPTPQAPMPPMAPAFSSYGQNATSPGMGEWGDATPPAAQTRSLLPVPQASDMSSNYGSEFPFIPGSPPAPTGTPQAPAPNQALGGTVNAPNLPTVQGQAHPLDVISKHLENGRQDPRQVVDAGKGRRALGLYGVLDSNLPEWGPKYAGRAVTAEEFLADPALQRKIAEGHMNFLLKNFGLKGAVQRWIGLEGKDLLGTDKDEYWRRYQNAVGKVAGPVFAGDMGQWGDPSISPAPATPGGATPMPIGAGGSDLSATRRTGEPEGKESGKALSTLADALRGVKMPEAPAYNRPTLSPNNPPAARPIDGNLIEYLTALLGGSPGKGKTPQLLTLNQASPGSGRR